MRSILKYKKAVIAVIFILIAVVIVTDYSENYRRTRPLKIALVLNENASASTLAIKQGMNIFAKENNIKLEVFTPPVSANIESYQIEVINNIQKSYFDGLAIIPKGGYALQKSLKNINSKNIQIIILEEPINNEYTYIGANHAKDGYFLMRDILKNKNNTRLLILKNEPQSDVDNKIRFRMHGIYQRLRDQGSLEYQTSLIYTNDEDLYKTVESKNINVIISMQSYLTDKAIALNQMLNNSLNVYGFDSNQMHLKFFAQNLLKQEMVVDYLSVGYKGLTTLVNKIRFSMPQESVFVDSYLIDKEMVKQNYYAELLYPIITK